MYIVSIRESRLACRDWIIGFAIYLTGIPILGAFLASGKAAEMDGICHIGLQFFGAIPTIVWDFSLNLYLSTVFAYRVYKSDFKTPVLRNLAIRTLIATGITLTTSFCNIFVLTVLKWEHGWLCLSLCTSEYVDSQNKPNKTTNLKPNLLAC